jgi:hypothetical protein
VLKPKAFKPLLVNENLAVQQGFPAAEQQLKQD